MGRRRKSDTEPKRRRGRPRNEEAEPETEELEEDDPTQPDEDEEEEQLELFEPQEEPLVPQKQVTRDRVFVRGTGGEPEVFDRENYNRLSTFLSDMPDRSSYSVMVWRVPSKGIGNREYVGMIPLPEEVLDEVIREEFGGGKYYWQLAYNGKFAKTEHLPADLAAQDLKMGGYLTIAGEPKARQADADVSRTSEINELRQHMEETQQLASTHQNAMMDLLKEQLNEQKKRADSGAQSMIQLFTVLMAGMQQQQQQASQLAQQQTTFMMNMMTLQDKKSEEMHSGRENLLREIIELMKAGMNPDAPQKPFGQVLLESLPTVLDKLKEVPGLANVSPRKQTAQVPAAPLPALPVAAPAALAPTPAQQKAAENQPFSPEDNAYLTDVVKAVWEAFQAKTPADDCADTVANIGSDEQFEKLVNSDNDFVSALVQGAWSAYQPGEAPKELLAYARMVHLELTREEEVPEGAPVQPAQSVQNVPPSQPGPPAAPGIEPPRPEAAQGEVKVSP